MTNGTSRTRWFKNGALAMPGRIALDEGCWRKYHPELNLNDSEAFLAGGDRSLPKDYGFRHV